MAKPRKGEKQWRVTLNTFVGRVRGEDGKRSAWHELDTDNPDLADQKLARWIETGEAPSKSDKELFADAALRVIARQAAKGEKGAKERRHRVVTFAVPVIGHLEIGRIEGHHVFSVLDQMGAQEGATREKYSVDTVHHLRVDLSRIFKELIREGAIKTNAARDIELPEDLEVDDRPRIVLTDEEVLRFRRRGFAQEIDMMALLARELGGMRTSDLHAADWADFDTVTWQTAFVRRPKTDREGSRKGKRKGRRRATRGFERVRHVLPESIVEPTRAWWRGQGSPVTGPVFPIRRGLKAGQRKTGRGISYAQALRDALWSEGIVRPLPGFEQAMGDHRRKLCALQVDTDDTRAVDFHSFRRAYVTALAASGVNAQTAMALAGHTDMATHQRYLAPAPLEVPAQALPQPPPQSPATPSTATERPPVNVTATTETPAPQLTAVLESLLAVLRQPGAFAASPIDPQRGSNEPLTHAARTGNPEQFPQRARKDSNLRPTASEAVLGFESAPKVAETRSVVNAHETPLEGVLTHFAGQSSTLLEGLRLQIARAAYESNWAVVDALRPIIDAERGRLAAETAPDTGVVDIDNFRRAKREGGK